MMGLIIKNIDLDEMMKIQNEFEKRLESGYDSTVDKRFHFYWEQFGNIFDDLEFSYLIDSEAYADADVSFYAMVIKGLSAQTTNMLMMILRKSFDSDFFNKLKFEAVTEMEVSPEI